jgi:hypothetical protein
MNKIYFHTHSGGNGYNHEHFVIVDESQNKISSVLKQLKRKHQLNNLDEVDEDNTLEIPFKDGSLFVHYLFAEYTLKIGKNRNSRDKRIFIFKNDNHSDGKLTTAVVVSTSLQKAREMLRIEKPENNFAQLVVVRKLEKFIIHTTGYPDVYAC